MIQLIFKFDGFHGCFVIVTGAKMFSYYIKIVPTMYVTEDGQTVHTNQFSVTKHEKVGATE